MMDKFPTKPNQTNHKLGTQGRKPKTQSTKAEMNRERLTAKVITCLVAGKTIQETATELDTAYRTVVRIRKELPDEFLHYFGAAKTNEMDELIEQGLKAQLESTNNLLAVTRDEDWVKKHSASELAILFGVVNDKVFRVLAAIERANERDLIEKVISETRKDLKDHQLFESQLKRLE